MSKLARICLGSVWLLGTACAGVDRTDRQQVRAAPDRTAQTFRSEQSVESIANRMETAGQRCLTFAPRLHPKRQVVAVEATHDATRNWTEVTRQGSDAAQFTLYRGHEVRLPVDIRREGPHTIATAYLPARPGPLERAVVAYLEGDDAPCPAQSPYR